MSWTWLCFLTHVVQAHNKYSLKWKCTLTFSGVRFPAFVPMYSSVPVWSPGSHPHAAPILPFWLHTKFPTFVFEHRHLPRQPQARLHARQIPFCLPFLIPLTRLCEVSGGFFLYSLKWAIRSHIEQYNTNYLFLILENFQLQSRLPSPRTC